MDILSHNSIPPFRTSHSDLRQTRSVFAKFCLAITFCIVLIACGPAEDKVDQQDLTIATQQIAQAYVSSGDLAQAQTSLAALEVANPNQWLLFVAESTAKDPAASSEVVGALLKLTGSSGLYSPVLERYAADHGLIDSSVASSSAPANVQPNASTGVDPQPENGASNAQAVPTATPEPIVLEATTAPEVEATIEATATATPNQSAQVLASAPVNLRTGPGTDYDLAGGLQVGEIAQILEKNQDASWWKVQLSSGFQGWVFSELVQTSGTVENVALASDIPPLPTAAPVAVAQATAAPIAAAPAAPAAPQNNGAPYFKLVDSHMWTKEQNGGCAGQHLLRINVIDANGVRLNGVALQGLYTGAIIRTGDQGKGDGIIEYDLYGSGEGFIVTTDSNGAAAGSDRAEGYTTVSPDVPWPVLIGAGYCSDDATCQVFDDSWGCKGHHSYEATFQRNY